MIDVLVAVEDPLVSMGLGAVFEGAEDCRLAGSVSTADRVEDAITGCRPDVVILDVAYRRRDSGLIPRIGRRSPAVRVLVLVDHTVDQCPVRDLLAEGSRFRLTAGAVARLDECCLTSLRGKARGCLPAKSRPEDVLRSIRTAMAGEIAAAPWLAAVAAAEGSLSGAAGAITARELEVLTLVAKGLGNKQLARTLRIQEQTAKNHIASIMAKLGVHSRAKLGLAAAHYGLQLVES